MQATPTYLHRQMVMNPIYYDRNVYVAKEAEPFLTPPRSLAIDQKPYFLTTYEFYIFVYSVPKEKDMIGISIITQNLFPQLQCMNFETKSITL